MRGLQIFLAIFAGLVFIPAFTTCRAQQLTPIWDVNTPDDELLLGWDGETMFFRRVSRQTEATKDSNWFIQSGREFGAVRSAGWTEFSAIQPMQLRARTAEQWPDLGPIQHVAIDAVREVMVLSAQTRAGDFDLYMAQRAGDSWTEPKALTALNSSGDEVFPNFEAGSLLFASNGHGGRGGFDVWRSHRRDQFEQFSSLDGGVNTAGDELAAVPAGARSEHGYYVSAVRMEGSGVDIWYVSGAREPDGSDRNREMGMEFRHRRSAVAGISVDIRERGGAVMTHAVSDDQGRVELGALKLDAAVEVMVERIDGSNLAEGTVCHVFERCPEGQCLDSHWSGWKRVRSYRIEGGKAFVFDLLPLDALSRWPRPSAHDAAALEFDGTTKHVFFSSSEYNLSNAEQSALCDWLIEQGWTEEVEGRLQVRGFTDTRGEAVSNHILSEQRARAVVIALQACGVSEEKVDWSGFGEDSKATDPRLARRVDVVWQPDMH
ncbi:MAG: OmpA family protein [Flavobacteriales bacterium]